MVAVKVGMVPYYDSEGVRHPATVLHMADNVCVAHKTEDKDGYDALVVGAVKGKDKHVVKPVRGLFDRLGEAPRRKLTEFRVSPDAFVPEGTPLKASHFVVGQYVDIRGKTKGKGFAGGMKRWGFKGQPASHGVSISHRSLGSTGASQGPGKVWKGKKMAGRMGGKNRTQQCLQVVAVDDNDSIVIVKGSVPGPKKGLLRVSDAIKRKFPGPDPPPFPTVLPEGADAADGDDE